MHCKKLIIGALTAAALTLTPAITANAATPAPSANPLVQSGEFKYNGSSYSINVTPAVGSRIVKSDGYRVASSYNVRVTKDTGAYGKAVYSSQLSYVRAAYLHTKIIGLETAREGGLNVKRDYNVSTYIKKVTAFSAVYDRIRLNKLISSYRKQTLRADVTSTAQHVRTYLAENGDLTGIENDKGVVVKREALFGYSGSNVSVRLFVDPTDSTKKTFEVVGLEKPDLYQSVHDSATGAVRSGPIDAVSNLD